MFGRKRKRKQEQDALGLPVDDDGSGLLAPPPASTVTVHDRGALTDAEVARLKQKLLGE